MLNTAGIPDGFFERKMVLRLIANLPIDILRSLFPVQVISGKDFITMDMPEWLRRKILELRAAGQVEYDLTVDIAIREGALFPRP